MLYKKLRLVGQCSEVGLSSDHRVHGFESSCLLPVYSNASYAGAEKELKNSKNTLTKPVNPNL